MSDSKIDEQTLLRLINEVREENGLARIYDISPQSSLRNDFEFDSLDLAVLVVKIEAISGMDVFESGIVDSVREVLERINKK